MTENPEVRLEAVVFVHTGGTGDVKPFERTFKNGEYETNTFEVSVPGSYGEIKYQIPTAKLREGTTGRRIEPRRKRLRDVDARGSDD